MENEVRKSFYQSANHGRPGLPVDLQFDLIKHAVTPIFCEKLNNIRDIWVYLGRQRHIVDCEKGKRKTEMSEIDFTRGRPESETKLAIIIHYYCTVR